MRGMNTFLKSDEFNSWLVDLKDRIGKRLLQALVPKLEILVIVNQ